MIQPGDIVVREFNNPEREPIYLDVIAVIPVKEYEKNMIYGERYIPETNETTKELHNVWEDEVKLVDMKGANI